MNVSASNSASANGSDSARPSRSSIARGSRATRRARREHLRALVDADDRSCPRCARARARRRRFRSRRRARARVGRDPRDEERAPARVLAEREEPGVAVVRRPERREELPGIHARDSMLERVALSEDVERIAAAAAAFAAAGGGARGVLAVETLGRRVYLCAFASADGHAWLALDGESRPIARHAPRARGRLARRAVRGGGGVGRRRRPRRSSARGSPRSARREAPEGIEEAEAAAAALAELVAPEPRVASGAYLDAIGVAARRLEAGARRQRRLAVRRGDAVGRRHRRGARGRRRAQLQAAATLA